jgi:CheY-like chemotaxis protein
MTARVLVVDDVAANVKLLEARLSAEYFDVVTAMSGEQGGSPSSGLVAQLKRNGIWSVPGQRSWRLNPNGERP